MQRVPPEALRPGEKELIANCANASAINIVHLIYRHKNYEGHARDYEFSGTSMREHWDSGAVNVRTGNFIYFDSEKQRIDPEHIMASGALPPALPSVKIEGEYYWDGGIVSNTSLQYLLEQDQYQSSTCGMTDQKIWFAEFMKHWTFSKYFVLVAHTSGPRNVRFAAFLEACEML